MRTDTSSSYVRRGSEIIVRIATGVLVLLSNAPWLMAQDQEDDSYFSFDGEENPVTVVLDQVAVLADEGVGGGDVSEIVSNLGLEVVGQFHQLFILGLEQPGLRADLVTLAREIQALDDRLLLGGLVLLQAGSDVPFMLTDQFIATFSPNVERPAIDALNAENGVEILVENPFWANQFVLAVTDTSPGDALLVARTYHQSNLTVAAYPNFVGVYDDTEMLLNDTLFGNQWHLRNTGQSGGTVDADSDASFAWDITLGDQATIIAVVENGGFDMSHPDLTPNIRVNPGEDLNGNGTVDPGEADGTDDDSNSYVDDLNGWDFGGCTSAVGPGCGDNNPSPANATENHGTSVAGVAAARGHNMLGVSGSCPECSLLLLRTGYNSSDFAKSLAFLYAQNQGARIISNSWAFTAGSATPNILAAINTVTAAGVVVLLAARNTTNNVCTGSTADPRVSHPNVFAVSSSTNQDRKVVVAAVGNCIDILAPSHRGYNATDPYTGTLNVTTTDRQGTAGYNNNSPVVNCPTTEAAPPPTNARDYTSCFGGTSSATPLTAGAVGLLLTADPGLTRQEITDR